MRWQTRARLSFASTRPRAYGASRAETRSYWLTNLLLLEDGATAVEKKKLVDQRPQNDAVAQASMFWDACKNLPLIRTEWMVWAITALQRGSSTQKAAAGCNNHLNESSASETKDREEIFPELPPDTWHTLVAFIFNHYECELQGEEIVSRKIKTDEQRFFFFF